MSPNIIHKHQFSETDHYEVIGISCHEKDFRFAFLLNAQLSFRFKKGKDFTQFMKSGDISGKFSFYYWIDDINRVVYYLLANRSEMQFLLPRLNTLDYVLIIKTENLQCDISEIQQKIKKIPEVLAVIRHAKIAKAFNFYEEVDMHFNEMHKTGKQEEETIKSALKKKRIKRLPG